MDQRLLKVDEDDRAEEGGAEVSQPPPHRPRAPRVVPAEGAAKDVVTALTDPRNNEDEEDRESDMQSLALSPYLKPNYKILKIGNTTLNL